MDHGVCKVLSFNSVLGYSTLSGIGFCLFSGCETTMK